MFRKSSRHGTAFLVLFLALLLPLALLSPCQAEDKPHSLSFSASFTATGQLSEQARGDTLYDMCLDLEYGYVVKDPWGVGLKGSISTQFTGKRSDVTGTADLLGILKYYFRGNDAVVPYVGTQAGLSWVGSLQETATGWRFGGDRTWSAGGMVGLKWKLRETVSLKMEYNLLAYLDGSGKFKNNLALGVEWCF